MKNFCSKLVLVSMLISISSTLFAQKEVIKTFSAKEKIKISMVSGDCFLKKANDNQISVKLTFSYPEDCFQFKMSDEGSYIRIKEEFDGNCSGESNWEISIPENTNIEFNSASGNLTMTDIKNGLDASTASGNMKLSGISGDIELSTASGNIFIEKSSGKINSNTASGDVKLDAISGIINISTASGSISATQVSNDFTFSVASGSVKIDLTRGKGIVKTASGDIEMTNGTGTFELKTASGNIGANLIELTGNSEFAAASGNVFLKLAKSSAYDLNLAAASGDVTLDYNGNDLNGYFEFTARKDKGKIVSPVKFDKEEIIVINGKDHDKKSFTKGSAVPKIFLKTSSGTVKLVK